MVRIWTLPDAEAALPEVEELLLAGQAAITAAREAHDNLQDLQIVYGDEVTEQGEYTLWQSRHKAAREDLENIQLRFEALGVEVKSLEGGLVDFRSTFGAHEVYLCWQLGEPRIGWWHTLDGGFSRRRPVPDFTPIIPPEAQPDQ